MPVKIDRSFFGRLVLTVKFKITLLYNFIYYITVIFKGLAYKRIIVVYKYIYGFNSRKWHY